MTGNSVRGRLQMRKSELAGWRTKSLLSANRQHFLPIIKLRGLPYYCTREDVVGWFGNNFARELDDVVIVQEVDEFNSGFALATFRSTRAAKSAWESLHRKAIGASKRFVEVFCLLPPNCPLTKRSAPSAPPAAADCPFCGCAYQQHADAGAASAEAARLLRSGALPRGAMNTQYLKVPALVYQDVNPTTSFDVQLYNPDAWTHNQIDGSTLLPRAAEASDTAALEFNGQTYLDLMCLDGYNVRHLLLEIYYAIQRNPSCAATLSFVANNLSLKARAYLFVTETKLQTLVEKYPHFYSVRREANGLLVAVQPGMTDYIISSLRASELTRKNTRGPKYGKACARPKAKQAAAKPAERSLQQRERELSRRELQLEREKAQFRAQMAEPFSFEFTPAPRKDQEASPSTTASSGNQLPSLLSASTPFNLAREADPLQFFEDSASSTAAVHRYESAAATSILESDQDFHGLLSEIIRGTSCTEDAQAGPWFALGELGELERSITCPDKRASLGRTIDALLEAEQDLL